MNNNMNSSCLFPGIVQWSCSCIDNGTPSDDPALTTSTTMDAYTCAHSKAPRQSIGGMGSIHGFGWHITGGDR